MSTSYNGNGSAPFVAGSDTSEEAAASIDGSAASLRNRVFAAVHGAGLYGMTCDEVEVALNLRHQTASARIRELFLASRLHDSLQRRRTRSNRRAVVWIV